jgi:hypothetical protein
VLRCLYQQCPGFIEGMELFKENNSHEFSQISSCVFDDYLWNESDRVVDTFFSHLFNKLKFNSVRMV